MKIRTLIATTAALQLLTLPAMAQGASDEQSGHHYQGGPKTEVPHHMGKKATSNETSRPKRGTTSGHHYQGGPKTEVPHHMGDKP